MRCLPLVCVGVAACAGGRPKGVPVPVGDLRFGVEGDPREGLDQLERIRTVRVRGVAVERRAIRR